MLRTHGFSKVTGEIFLHPPWKVSNKERSLQNQPYTKRGKARANKQKPYSFGQYRMWGGAESAELRMWGAESAVPECRNLPVQYAFLDLRG